MTLTPRILVNDQAQGEDADLIKVSTLWMTVLLSRQEMKGLKGEIVAGLLLVFFHLFVINLSKCEVAHRGWGRAREARLQTN